MYKQTYYFSKQTFKTFLSETLFWPENNGEVSNRSNFYLIFFFIAVGLYISLFVWISVSVREPGSAAVCINIMKWW